MGDRLQPKSACSEQHCRGAEACEYDASGTAGRLSDQTVVVHCVGSSVGSGASSRGRLGGRGGDEWVEAVSRFRRMVAFRFVKCQVPYHNLTEVAQ
jgi:hypothetical protein